MTAEKLEAGWSEGAGQASVSPDRGDGHRPERVGITESVRLDRANRSAKIELLVVLETAGLSRRDAADILNLDLPTRLRGAGKMRRRGE